MWKIHSVFLPMIVLVLPVLGPLTGRSAEEPEDVLAAYLEARLRSHPEDATGWRMLGQLRLQRGNHAGAIKALELAVQLDPNRAAAHFDLGRAFLALGRTEDAADHLRRCIQVAPDSTYAAEARVLSRNLPAPQNDPSVVPAGFEVNRFERPTGGITPPLPPPGLLNLRLDAGAIYNTNVQLAPISRDLFPQARASPQGFLAPHLEYSLPLGDTWRVGPLFHGYFNVNEGGLGAFDLQHYQPGLFVARVFSNEAAELVPRLQYDFSYDAFAGTPFGTRHALTPSLTTRWSSGQESVLFWTLDYTRFNDEGVFPPNTSRNGWTNTVGLSHVLYPDLTWVRLLRGGVEGQLADLVGRDFRYLGFYAYGEVQFPFLLESLLGLKVGAGYRDFFEWSIVPSRNEAVWQAGLEIRKDFTGHWSAKAIFSYDRFASPNPLFDANRYFAGIVVTYRY